MSLVFSTTLCKLVKYQNWSFSSLPTGTFGQAESWSIHISSSWIHPGVPFEVLTDPLSMPDHEILNVKTGLSHAINPDMTEEDRGELKVNCIISQKLTWAVQDTVSAFFTSPAKRRRKKMQILLKGIEAWVLQSYNYSYGKDYCTYAMQVLTQSKLKKVGDLNLEQVCLLLHFRLCDEIVRHTNKLSNHSALKCFDAVAPPHTSEPPHLSLASIDPIISSTDELSQLKKKMKLYWPVLGNWVIAASNTFKDRTWKIQ